MCSGSEEGSYLRLTDFVYHSTLDLRVIKKKKRRCDQRPSTNLRFPMQILDAVNGVGRLCVPRGRIFIELVTPDRKLKASRKGSHPSTWREAVVLVRLQGYLAHKKRPPP